MIREITWTHIQSVWNHSGPSEVPSLFRKPVAGQELFFAASYSKPALALYLLPMSLAPNFEKNILENEHGDVKNGIFVKSKFLAHYFFRTGLTDI